MTQQAAVSCAGGTNAMETSAPVSEITDSGSEGSLSQPGTSVRNMIL